MLFENFKGILKKFYKFSGKFIEIFQEVFGVSSVILLLFLSAASCLHSERNGPHDGVLGAPQASVKFLWQNADHSSINFIKFTFLWSLVYPTSGQGGGTAYYKIKKSNGLGALF